MKLLLGVPDLDLATGGLSVVAERLAAELVRQSHSVTLAYSVDPTQPRLALSPGVQALEYPRHASAWQRWRTAKATLRNWIANERPDLLHDHGLWTPQNAAFQSEALSQGLPLVQEPCGMLLDWAMQQRRLKKRLALALYQRRLLARSECVIVTCDDERSDIVAHLPVGPELLQIPHGVDFPPTMPQQPRHRRAVFLGRLHPVKQVDVLLRAWAHLRPVGWEFHIAGGGDPSYVQQLHQLVRTEQLEASVRFLGPIQGTAKSDLLFGSQLLLQPSLQENFGMAIAEGLAHGLPTLTTRTTPWSEIETQHCGWWVAPDEQAVQAALSEALALPSEQLSAMGARARQVAAHYSWAATTRRTVAAYERALERRRGKATL